MIFFVLYQWINVMLWFKERKFKFACLSSVYPLKVMQVSFKFDIDMLQ